MIFNNGEKQAENDRGGRWKNAYDSINCHSTDSPSGLSPVPAHHQARGLGETEREALRYRRTINIQTPTVVGCFTRVVIYKDYVLNNGE